MNEMYDPTSLYILSVYLTTQKQVEPLEGESEEEIDVAVNRRRTNRLNYIMLAFKNVSVVSTL